jgi:NAD+ diphosphatase
MTGPVPPSFIPSVEPAESALVGEDNQPRGLCFAFVGAELLIARGPDETVQIPGWDQLREWGLAAVRWQYLGALNGEPCWSAELVKEEEPPPGATLTGLRPLYEQISEVEYALAGRAAQIVAWERDHQFCGRCGSPTESVRGDRARRCPVCGLQAYPRLSPAVITLIERGETILLARGHAFQPGRFGIIAGFVEPGETLEEAVRREVREEVGFELDRVEYFGSQPWPFPHGIMIGFRANHLEGEITIDDGELAEAGWYRLDDLPNVPGKLSIARQLIDDWARRRGAVIDQP